MKFLSGFLSGFVVETLASLDDTISRIPILMGVTRTLTGKIMFAFGGFLAIFGCLAGAFFFSDLVREIEWFHYLSAGLIYAVAIISYLDFFGDVHINVKKLKKRKRMYRWLQLGFLGFVVSFLALIDDTLLILPLFEESHWQQFWVSVGVVLSTFIQLVLLVAFTKQLDSIPYRQEIAAGGLLIYGTLVLFQVI